MTPKPSPPPRYHHGDLRQAVLREAEAMLRAHGLEGLSLRRLAEQAGVTAPALYHHFRGKNDLLCALAEAGFVELDATITQAIADHTGSERTRLARFVTAYVGFAAEHPEIYDLMFGRTIWKGGKPTESLRTVAYATFRRYVERAVVDADLRAGDRARKTERGLRSAQVAWATVHGLCRLLIDGIYLEREDLAAMTDAAVDVLFAASKRS